ncbi:MAG: ABC transporter permease [Candidatus Magnetominusculus sp. LBB02]|nr:ABC transporter permease [Candidatus Magnetominusculus sp. LBB02]
MDIIKRIIKYRQLFIVLVWREFAVRYRYSVIGVMWAGLQPLSMMLLFTFIFTYIMKLHVSSYPSFIFYFAGLIPWTFFSQSLNASIPSLTNHYQLITKIYFPRELLPLSSIAAALVDFFICAAILFVFIVIYNIHLTWNVLWVLPLIVLLVIFTTSVSLFLAGLNVYYRDVRLASNFLIQLWFFMSPVMYSVDSLSTRVKLLLFLNPLTFIIENMRRVLLEGRGIVLWQMAFVCAVTAVFYIVLCRFFIKIERAFADVI